MLEMLWIYFRAKNTYSLYPQIFVALTFYTNFDYLFFKKIKVIEKSNIYLNYIM
jgi:hypothetical protein